jgi:hypothetical protein
VRQGLRLVVLSVVAVSAATAQARPSLSVMLPPSAAVAQGPMVRASNLFGDRRGRELLAAGFPTRVTLEVALWGGARFGDEVLGQSRSDWIIQYDAIAQAYRVARVAGDSLIPVGRYTSLPAAVDELSAPRRVPLVPPTGRRRMYYTARLTVAALTNTDLAEAERWLRGDVGGALQGERKATSAVTGLMRSLMSRVLGGQVIRVDAQSERFDR